jgi:hypothetical protein
MQRPRRSAAIAADRRWPSCGRWSPAPPSIRQRSADSSDRDRSQIGGSRWMAGGRCKRANYGSVFARD